MSNSPVSPTLERLAWYAWRFLVVSGAVAVIAWALGRVAVVAGAVFLGLIISRGLAPVNRFLRKTPLRPGGAAFVSLLLFVVILVGIVAIVAATLFGQMDSLSESLDSGAREIEEWVTSLSLVDVDSSDLQRIRAQAAKSISNIGGNGTSLFAGVMTIGKLIVGLLLALIVSFFFLKDGAALRARLVQVLPPRHQPVAFDAGNRAWDALGGYLRGSVLLGIAEAAIIAITLAATGSSLIAPVMLLTFVAAFVPIVGAIAAGVVASLVALSTGGVTAALITAGVALVVQQLDNDLLAPALYGKALRLHPLVVLLGVAAGGSAFGLAGSVCAVPVLAVLSGIRGALKQRVVTS